MIPPGQTDRAPSDSASRQGHPTIYPPPPQAVFPIPPRRSHTENSSGTSSSGSKRKRAVVDDGSDTGHSRTRASSTSDFNNNTKAQVREQYNNKCWHCGANPADVCHIIGSRDNTFRDALRDGLIDFPEKQNPQNAIALCGTCHTNFDHVYNPSFFFLPTDLKYFLNYERQDRKRRRRLGRRTGTILGRICPTAQTYQDHQRRQGVEGAGLGGLYTRIVINDFLPEYPGRAPFQPGPSEYGATKSWTGSPMASLQRAVLMLRKLNLRGIPREIRDDLRKLQDAYSEELDLDGSDTSSQGSIELEPREPEEKDLDEGKGETFGYRRREPGTKSQQGRAEQRFTSGNRAQDDEEHTASKDEGRTSNSEDREYSEANLEEAFSRPRWRHPDVDCTLQPGNSLSWPWRWGPGATSDDAAKFFQRVL